MNFNSKNGRKGSFLMKWKLYYHLSQWGESAYGVQSWNESRLLRKKPAFVQFDEQTLTLKMVESNILLMKPKHQYHLSQWGKCVYGS